jgi:G3E family GTPase
MDAIQTIEPHELANWTTSCDHCKTEKVILLRNHIAEANHQARIYTGHKMKFLREPKMIQQRLYNQEKKDVMLELEYWLHNSETRHYGLRTITNSFVHPLPEKLLAECKCAEEQHQLPIAKKPVVLRPLIMQPMGVDKFKIAAMYF